MKVGRYVGRYKSFKAFFLLCSDFFQPLIGAHIGICMQVPSLSPAQILEFGLEFRFSYIVLTERPFGVHKTKPKLNLKLKKYNDSRLRPEHTCM